MSVRQENNLRASFNSKNGAWWVTLNFINLFSLLLTALHKKPKKKNNFPPANYRQLAEKRFFLTFFRVFEGRLVVLQCSSMGEISNIWTLTLSGLKTLPCTEQERNTSSVRKKWIYLSSQIPFFSKNTNKMYILKAKINIQLYLNLLQSVFFWCEKV